MEKGRPGKLDIFNMALGFIGARMLASENERTPEATQCALYWDRARRSALRDFPWPFCQRRIRLMHVPMPEEQSGDWGHAYGMPVTALKINRINDYAAFAIEQTDNGLRIFCNESEAIAVCSMDTPDITLWDELFITVMAYRLALFIAVPLLKNNSAKIQELSQLYQTALPKAEGHAASEGRRARYTEDNWITARGNWQ